MSDLPPSTGEYALNISSDSAKLVQTFTQFTSDYEFLRKKCIALTSENQNLHLQYEDVQKKYISMLEEKDLRIAELEKLVTELKNLVETLKQENTEFRDALNTFKEEKKKEEDEKMRQLLLGQIAFRFMDNTFTKIFEDPKKRRGELRCNTLKQLEEDATSNRLTGDELKRWTDLKTEWAEKEKKKWWHIERALKVLKKGRLDHAHPSFKNWEEKQIAAVIKTAKEEANDNGTAEDIDWIYSKLVANAQSNKTSIIH